MTPKPCAKFSANPVGHVPRAAAGSFIHDSAHIIGNVRIGREVFVGPTAVIRADEPDENGSVMPITISHQCNIQDGAILHALGGTNIRIGSQTSISHGAVVHGPCLIGSKCFVGFRAVVFNAILGSEVYVGLGAIVQNVRLRKGSLVPSGRVIVSQKDADQLCPIGPQERRFMHTVVQKNILMTLGYSKLVSSPGIL